MKGAVVRIGFFRILPAILIIIVSTILLSNSSIAKDSETFRSELQHKIISLYKDRKFREAIPYAKKYAISTKRDFGGKSQRYSDALYNLGVLYYHLGIWKESSTYFRRALTVLGLSGPVPPKAPIRLIFPRK